MKTQPTTYTPPEVTFTPDLSDPWYAGQVLPRCIPGLGWLKKPVYEPKAQTYPPPAIMEPANLARIEEQYQAWERTWKA